MTMSAAVAATQPAFRPSRIILAQDGTHRHASIAAERRPFAPLGYPQCMQRVLASIAGCTIVLGSLTHAAGRDASASASSAGLPRTLIISAAPQDAEVFVAWSPLAGAEYTLRWKAATAAEWS